MDNLTLTLTQILILGMEFNIKNIIIRILNYTIDSFFIVFILVVLQNNGLILIEEKPSFHTLTIVITLHLFYYFTFESLFSQTLGKMFTNTKVVTLNDEKPSAVQILIRSLFRFIPFDNISFCINLNFHDKFSKTKVISK